jgi:hypothetical protein|tara:strand:- start:1791 stop:2165 length:375 start_codon:yes stop_codon:yes gene_type:complete
MTKFTKQFLSILTACFFIVLAFGSDEVDVQYAEDLGAIKEAIDDSFENMQAEYEELCDSKRNSANKSDFIMLNGKLASIMSSYIENNTNLSFDEQKTAQDYAEQTLGRYPDLSEFRNTGTIPCW